MRGSVKVQMGYIWQHIDGIGHSKAEFRSKSDRTSLDGKQPVSGLVHSFKYKDEIWKTGLNLAQFARENFGIKDMEKINANVIEAWIEEKIANGVSQGSLKNYIAHLAKIQLGLEQIAQEKGKEYQAFTREDLQNIREEYIQQATKTEHENRAYQNPEAVISHLQGKEYVAAKLQLEYGLRIAEATFIKQDQLQGNTLVVQGKGGYILEKQLDPQIASKIRENMDNGVFKVNQNTFRENLQKACMIEGEKYTGAHGLRYNFAQNTYTDRLRENIEKGLSIDQAQKDALKYTSEAMGHHREEITKHYLG